MDKNASLAERRAYNEGLEAAAMVIDKSQLAYRRMAARDIRSMKVHLEYPLVEEVMELRPPQAEVLRHMPDPVADTMDRAQLAAWGKHD